ncbi:MAG TPA: hypothetical protein VJ761_14280, partial [Ktedonobacteraceae bacterium]|nr:hypothetical protein [Ktedonobacteraceae bacterium]
LLVFNLNRASITNELMTLDLVPKPEKLTELYFNNSINLPDSVPTSQVIRFAFVIHNLETTDYTYVYEVSVHASGTQLIVDSGNVVVKNNQYFVKNERLKLTSTPGRQEIVVTLTNLHQSIDFWLGGN